MIVISPGLQWLTTVFAGVVTVVLSARKGE